MSMQTLPVEDLLVGEELTHVKRSHTLCQQVPAGFAFIMGSRMSFNTVFFILNFVLFVALISLQYGFHTARHAINVIEMCEKFQDRDDIKNSPATVGKEGVMRNYNAVTWNEDWDGRHQQALQHGLVKPQGTMRRLWMIRHGEYITDGTNKGHLTDRGKQQAEYIGKRLRDMRIHFDAFISSTSIRARETTDIIVKFLPKMEVERSDILKEGQPIYPDPGFPVHVPKDKTFDEDGVRVEQAFRKYFHRPEIGQKFSQSNEIIVTHGNIISYFTLRGLQVPPERWLKLQVIQGSISMFEVTSDGHVNVRIIGDMGHIPLTDWTG